MDQARERRVAAVVNAIERHLQENPAAADSELGIAQWWLSAQGMHASADELSEALERLAKQGRLETLTVGDVRVWRAAQAGGS